MIRLALKLTLAAAALWALWTFVPVRGRTLAERLQLKAGATVTVAGRGSSGSHPIAGIVASGEEDDRLLIPLPLAQQLVGLPGQATQFRLLLPAGLDSAAEARQLQSLFPDLTVREVRQVARANQQLRDKVLLLFSVAAVAVGHAWSVTFGDMGVIYQTLVGLVKMDSASLAPFAALMLGFACLACGLAAAWILGETGSRGRPHAVFRYSPLAETRRPVSTLGRALRVGSPGRRPNRAISRSSCAASTSTWRPPLSNPS